jgi:murein DD-endopeptidase MepM/ murein hydrolase activator NlpD
MFKQFIQKVIDKADKRIKMLDTWTQDGWKISQSYGLTDYAKKLEADYQAGKYKHRVYPHIQHIGYDYSGKKTGFQVRAMHDGQVRWAGTNKHKQPRGIYVSLWDTAQEIATIYLHLSDVAVKKYDIIKAGDVIGYVGNTGLSHGTHCHCGAYYTKDGYILESINDLGGSFDFRDKKIVRLSL